MAVKKKTPPDGGVKVSPPRRLVSIGVLWRRAAGERVVAAAPGARARRVIARE